MITCATLSLTHYLWGSQYSVCGGGGVPGAWNSQSDLREQTPGFCEIQLLVHFSWHSFWRLFLWSTHVLMILTTPAWEANACWSFENSRKFMILTIFLKFPLFTCLSSYRILESVGESENFTITMSMCVKSIDLTLSPPCRIMNLVVQSPAHQLDHLLLIDCVVKFSIPAVPSFFFQPWILMLLPPPFV